MNTRERIAWLLSVGVLAVLAFQIPGSLAQRDDEYRFVRTLIDVHRLISANYVEPVNDEKLREAAIEGLITELGDPFTTYVPPEQHQAFEQMLEGSFEGVGIELNQDGNGAVTVVTPYEGSPAAEAGVLGGDVILKVNGEEIAGQRMQDVIKRIKGPLGSEVTLTVRHTTGEVVELKMKRQQIVVATLKGYKRKADQTWDYFIEPKNKIAYVRFTQFTPESADKLQATLVELQKQGMKGLVFDLRWNPGGRLDEAIKIIDLFVKEGVIVSTKGRNRPEQIVRAQAEGTLPYFPMVVLINEHAASASEVTSGALKDNKRALILGTRSFGKGSVQEPISLGDEGDLKLTVAYYYLPSGRLVHRKKDATDWGVEPDINVPMDEETQKLVFRGQIESDRIVSPVATQPATKPTTKPVDVQLQRAVEVLAAHIMMDPNNKGDLVRDVAAEQAPTTAPAAATPSTKPTEATPPAAPAAPATPATPATLPSTRPSTLPASDSGASK